MAICAATNSPFAFRGLRKAKVFTLARFSAEICDRNMTVLAKRFMNFNVAFGYFQCPRMEGSIQI